MIKIKCSKCGDIIEDDGRGTMVWCKCYAIGIDDHFGCVRIIGNADDWEEIK